MPKKEWVTAASEGVPEHNRDAMNAQLEGDGTFFISWVPDMDGAREKFGLSDERQYRSETALVRRGTNIWGLNEYFILPGDHRAAYEAVINQGFDACFAYYERHKEKPHA